MVGADAHLLALVLQETFALYTFALGFNTFLFIFLIWRSITSHSQTAAQYIHHVLDFLTYSAPPTIPTVYLMLTHIARTRLDREGMTLLYSKALRVAAKVNMVCFDKTGTLTDSVVRAPFMHLLQSNVLGNMSTCQLHKVR